MGKWGGPAHSFIAPNGSFVVFDAGGSNMFVSFKKKGWNMERSCRSDKIWI